MIPLFETKQLPGLKRRDIQPCAVCGKGVMHAGAMHFYRVTIEQYVVNPPAIQRQHGLELQMGNAAIAQAMGPDEDLAKQMFTTPPRIVCGACLMAPHALVIALDRPDESEQAERQREFDRATGSAA